MKKILLLLLLCYCYNSSIGQNYKLPFPVGKTYTCTQGNFGSYSHDDKSKYAFDFNLPVGASVSAARGGTVYLLEESFPNGNCPGGEKTCWNDVNFVIIDHGDGTYGQYYHLDQYGVLVNKGDRVSQGQVIARSGNSGWSTAAHLHFMVMNSGGQWRQSIPISFCDVSDNGGVPRSQRSYTSGSCGPVYSNAPNLLSPSNRATGVSTTVRLNWTRVSGATAYRVAVATSPSGFDAQSASLFPNPVYNQNTGTNTNATFYAKPYTKYYWVVRSFIPNIGSEVTEIREFTTGR